MTVKRRTGVLLATLLATTGLAALAPAASAQAAAPSAINTTIDANSQLRWGPYLSSRKAGVTGALSNFYVYCYTRGSDYNDGKHHTNVWYFGVVTDNSTHTTYYDVYSWGGNVNTPHDPPAGLDHCDALAVGRRVLGHGGPQHHDGPHLSSYARGL